MIITITIVFCESRLKYRNFHNDHNHRNDHNEIITYWFVALTGGVGALWWRIFQKKYIGKCCQSGYPLRKLFIPESLASIARMVHFLFEPSFRHVLSASSLDMFWYSSLSLSPSIQTCVSLQMRVSDVATAKRWNSETAKQYNGETVHSVYSSHTCSPSSV